MNADVFCSLPMDNWVAIVKSGVGDDEAEHEFPQHLAFGACSRDNTKS